MNAGTDVFEAVRRVNPVPPGSIDESVYASASELLALLKERAARPSCEVLVDTASRPTQPESRHRWPIAAVAAAVLAVVVTAVVLAVRDEPIKRVPAAPPSTAPAEEAARRVGFMGLPPPGATPSAPERGELVVYVAGPDVGSRTWVYADGRLIWHRYADLPEGANPNFTGFLEQRLTPEGVEFLQSVAVSQLEGDGGPPGRRHACRWRAFCEILVRNDGRIVSVPWPGDDSPVVARITEPASWLPASAWEDPESRAYVPARYRINRWPDTLNLLPQAALDLLEDPDLTIEEMRLLVEVLEDAGLEPVSSGNPVSFENSLKYHIETGGDKMADLFLFEPVLPHGQVYCQHCG